MYVKHLHLKLNLNLNMYKQTICAANTDVLDEAKL